MHSFPNSLSIETRLSIEFAPPSRALQAQFGVGLYKTHAHVAGFYENCGAGTFSTC